MALNTYNSMGWNNSCSYFNKMIQPVITLFWHFPVISHGFFHGCSPYIKCPWLIMARSEGCRSSWSSSSTSPATPVLVPVPATRSWSSRCKSCRCGDAGDFSGRGSLWLCRLWSFQWFFLHFEKPSPQTTSQLPSGYVRIALNSYWKWPFIVDVLIEHGDFWWFFIVM